MGELPADSRQGFFGKAAGLHGEPMSESDVHKLMCDDQLCAAVNVSCPPCSVTFVMGEAYCSR